MILDGKKLALRIQQEIKQEVQILKTKEIHPCLAVCLVGDDTASNIYVSRKQEACEKVGIRIISLKMPAKTSQNEILDFINDWNEDKAVHGILVQLPLPAHFDCYTVVNAISPKKDVDGFHAFNIGNIAHGKCNLLPCTPSGIMHLLAEYNIDLIGKHVCIINSTNVVGKPLSLMMLNEKATVTICHEHTVGLKEISSMADIVVTAVGKRPKFVLSADYVKKGAVVIDVGINRIDGKVVGDVDFDTVSKIASAITPVPGSIGPLTIAFLLKNTVKAAK
jgi:methylenetetrahydrofolate dehydrogenase (NADP+)/methenyltetrahydrofolate cyclohydrolase